MLKEVIELYQLFQLAAHGRIKTLLGPGLIEILGSLSKIRCTCVCLFTQFFRRDRITASKLHIQEYDFLYSGSNKWKRKLVKNQSIERPDIPLALIETKYVFTPLDATP